MLCSCSDSGAPAKVPVLAMFALLQCRLRASTPEPDGSGVEAQVQRNWLLVPPHRTVAEGSDPSPRPPVLQGFRGDSRGPLFHARSGYLYATHGRMIGKPAVMWTLVARNEVPTPVP